jgi:hypothetical protein
MRTCNQKPSKYKYWNHFLIDIRKDIPDIDSTKTENIRVLTEKGYDEKTGRVLYDEMWYQIDFIKARCFEEIEQHKISPSQVLYLEKLILYSQKQNMFENKELNLLKSLIEYSMKTNYK